jgi:protein ImuB
MPVPLFLFMAAWVIPPGQAAEVLGPLPLQALRLPAATIDLLEPLGIEQVSQLLGLPRTSLSSRFGDGVLLRIDQALGAIREPILAHHAPPPLQAAWLLEYPTPQRDAVECIVRQLIERVAHLLVEQNRGAVRMEIRLRCVPAGPASWEPVPAQPEGRGSESSARVPAEPISEEAAGAIRELLFRLDLFRPTAAASHLFELIRLQFDQTAWPAEVQEVTVQVPLAAPLEVRQRELFDETRRDGQRKVAALVDRLSSRLGRDRVVQPRLVADAQPERACRLAPLAGRVARRRNRAATETAAPLPVQPVDRPLHLVHPPLPLEMLAAAPDGPPARIRLQRRWHTIQRHWGPERIETGWWRGRTVRRDYYRVETAECQWFWVFQQLDDGLWFLHGRFE